MRIVALADTHLRDATADRLPAAAVAELERADVILHAGDVVEAGLLAELEAMAPTHAVLGNNDVALAGTLPGVVELDLAGVRVGMIHDSGRAAGRERRMRRRFPDADLVVFGHSHIPCNAPGAGGQRLFNPGSPTQRRRQPHRTVGVLDLDGGRVVRSGIVVVD
jgi:putative phosphoesterase